MNYTPNSKAAALVAPFQNMPISTAPSNAAAGRFNGRILSCRPLMRM